MARGIVVGKPATGGAGSTGKIIVTEGGASSDPVSGAATAAIEAGTIVNFRETTDTAIGDIADFKITDGVGTGITTVMAGTVLTGTITDNIVVAAGQAVTVRGGTLEGKITVNGGILAVIGSSFIYGKVEAPVGNSFVFIDNQTTIEGKLDVNSASTLSVRNSTVDGKLSSSGSIFTSVTGCTIRGKLEVLNAGTCKCSGNTVEGQTNTPGCTA